MPMMARDTHAAPRARSRPHESRSPSLAVQGAQPAPAHQHGTCPCGGGCPACAAKSGSKGQALDPGTRSYFESSLGADLGGVRIHANTESAQSARALQASAFSAGQDIHFGEGRFRPQSEEGRNLLGHELIHVLQQRHLALGADPAVAHRDHALEQNARDVATHGAPIARADRPMILRQGAGETPHPFTPTTGLGSTPQLNIGGHTIEGDTQAAQSLLQSQLTVSPLLMPLYLGVPMTLFEVSATLARVTPALTEQARWGLVHSIWMSKVAAVRQLPPLFLSPIQFPLPPLNAAGAGPVGPRVLPSPAQAAANYLGQGQGSAGPAGSSSGATAAPAAWTPTFGPQVLINITRGAGIPRTAVSGQRQYALGNDLQAIFQDATDVASGAYSAVAGGQAQTTALDSKIIQLQPFVQLLAGISQLPASLVASMTVQFSLGLQVTAKFGPVTVQATAGFQETAQTGQPTTAAAAFSVMAGPTPPAAGAGPRASGVNWSVGLGPIGSPAGQSYGSGTPSYPSGRGLFVQGTL